MKVRKARESERESERDKSQVKQKGRMRGAKMKIRVGEKEQV